MLRRSSFTYNIYCLLKVFMVSPRIFHLIENSHHFYTIASNLVQNEHKKTKQNMREIAFRSGIVDVNTAVYTHKRDIERTKV